MTIDITKPLDTELARTLPGYIRETRAALEGAVTDSSSALAAVGILETAVDDLAALIAAALVKFPNQGVFVNGDATPSVSGGIIYRTANTTSTAITYLDGGFAGQMVIIVADDENTTVVHNPGYIILEGGVSITFNANQGIILVCHENSIGNKQWIQVGSIGGGSSTGNAKFNRDTFTVGVGGQSSFDTSVAFQTGQKLMFPYVNGELQPSSKFTEVDSNTITFGETLPEGTFVELVYITTLSVTTSVDDLFVVNKPYLDVRQYSSFAEAITYAVNQSKVLLISRPVSISANMTIEANLLCITGGELQIASGYNIVFDGSVTLEAGSKISTTAGGLTFNNSVILNGGVIENIDGGNSTEINGPLTCGLYQCFDGDGSVIGLKEVRPENFGAKGDGTTDDIAALRSAALAAPHIVLTERYASSGTVTFALNDVNLTGHGTILASGNGYPLLKFTGLRPKISGITVEGTATESEVVNQVPNQTQFRKALIEINGESLTEAQSAEVSGVTIHNAFETGLFLYKTVGVKVLNCTIQSGQTASLPELSAPFVDGIYSYSSAIIQISNNNIRGYGEGTVIGTDGTTLIDLFDGSSPTTRTRKIIISDNTYTDQVDHSVYISNYASEYNIANNLLKAKLQPALKLEGDHLVVSGNSITQGITTRHIQSDAIISDNDIYIHSGGPYVYGILLTTDLVGIAEYTTTRNITITGNSVTCDPLEQSRAGIAVQGLVYGVKQILLSNINISNNVVSGFGYNVSEASGILVDQQLFPTNPVTGTKVLNTTISGNTIEMADVSGLTTPNDTSGITLQRGLYGVVVSGNIIKRYTSTAVRSLGVSQMLASGNVILSPILTTYGFYERGHDTTLHYNSELNMYGVNLFGGSGNAIDVSRADQSSIRTDLKNLAVTTGSNLSYDPPRYGYKDIFINATVASKTITLTAVNWWLNESVTVYNTGANAFTVTNGTITKSVAVGSNITFVHTGSNSFVTDK